MEKGEHNRNYRKELQDYSQEKQNKNLNKSLEEIMDNLSSKENYYKDRAKEMFSVLTSVLYREYEAKITKNTKNQEKSFKEEKADLDHYWNHGGHEGYKHREHRELGHHKQEDQYPKHLVLVLEDVDNPDFLMWSLMKSKNLIKEHQGMENSGVLVASFKGNTLLETRILSVNEALSMIP